MQYSIPNHATLTANVFNASFIPPEMIMSTKDGQKNCIFLYFVSDAFIIRFPNGEDFRPSAGTVCYLPPKKRFALSGAPASDIVCITASGSIVDTFIYTCDAHSSKLTLRPSAIDAFTKLKELLENPEKTTEWSNRAMLSFYSLLVETVYAPAHTVERKPDIIAQRIKNYIDNNIQEDISVYSIARYFYLSETHVIRVFRDRFLETPKQYILRRKIEESKKMLLDTSLQIKEIAMIFNFSDSYHFSHTFKRLTGFSPEKFRMREDARKDT